MPIKVPNNLPAIETLTSENIFVMTDTRAKTPWKYTVAGGTGTFADQYSQGVQCVAGAYDCFLQDF